MADMMDYTFYGTVSEADAYFSHRLHSTKWAGAFKENSLIAATRIVDALAYKGDKHSVWTLWQGYTWPIVPTQLLIHAAELAQVRQFPRDNDTVAPEDIRAAVYEIAYALLDGKDPELELQALAIRHQSYGPVSTTYNREQLPQEHTENGVPSVIAWRLLRPYLRTVNEFGLSRVN